MSLHVIANPVPTPEEMGEILGLSPDRVNAVRAIMNTPGRAEKSAASARSKSPRKAAAKKKSRSRARAR